MGWMLNVDLNGKFLYVYIKRSIYVLVVLVKLIN